MRHDHNIGKTIILVTDLHHKLWHNTNKKANFVCQISLLIFALFPFKSAKKKGVRGKIKGQKIEKKGQVGHTPFKRGKPLY